MVTASLEQVDFALIIENSYSSNIERFRKQVAGLTIAHKIIHSELDTRDMFDAIVNAERDNMVIVGGGGDGTANGIAQAILSPEGVEAGLPDIPFIPARGGNANDVARSLNGKHSIEDVVRRGRQMGVHPLEIKIDERPTKIALGYFSIGGTASAAKAIHDMKGRHNRATELPHHIAATVREMAEYKPFKYTTDSHEQMQYATELIFARIERMGEKGRPDAKISEDEFEFITGNITSRDQALGKLIRIGLPPLIRGKMGEKMNAVHVQLGTSDTEQTPLLVQLDGEVDKIPHDSEVSIAISRRSLTTLTTRH